MSSMDTRKILVATAILHAYRTNKIKLGDENKAGRLALAESAMATLEAIILSEDVEGFRQMVSQREADIPPESPSVMALMDVASFIIYDLGGDEDDTEGE